MPMYSDVTTYPAPHMWLSNWSRYCGVSHSSCSDHPSTFYTTAIMVRDNKGTGSTKAQGRALLGTLVNDRSIM